MTPVELRAKIIADRRRPTRKRPREVRVVANLAPWKEWETIGCWTGTLAYPIALWKAWRYVSAHPTAKAEIQIRSVVARVDDVSTKED